MTSTPVFPSIITPIADNILMDANSDAEAKQVALELAQAQERVCATNEAWEKCREDWKRTEEERKAKIVAAMKLGCRTGCGVGSE